MIVEFEFIFVGVVYLEGFGGVVNWEYGDFYFLVIFCFYLFDEFIECEDLVDYVGNVIVF